MFLSEKLPWQTVSPRGSSLVGCSLAHINLASFFPRALPVLMSLLAKTVALDSLVQSDLLAFVALRVAKVLL